MDKKVREEKARQGRWGSNVLVVLVVGLLLAMVVWFGAEMFGRSTETERTQQTEGAGEPAAD